MVGHGKGRAANPIPKPAVSERAANTNSPATSPNPTFIANFLVSGIIRITVPPYHGAYHIMRWTRMGHPLSHNV